MNLATRALVTLCCSAIINGKTEIEVGSDPHFALGQFARTHRDELDDFAETLLPRALWGTPLRLVWTTHRTHSATVVFLDGRRRPPTPDEWAAAREHLLGIERRIG